MASLFPIQPSPLLQNLARLVHQVVFRHYIFGNCFLENSTLAHAELENPYEVTLEKSVAHYKINL